MQQRVIISQDIEHDLAQAIAETEHDRVFVLTDDITQECCLPKVAVLFAKHNATTITIRHDDTNKTLATLADVWTALQRGGATRHSLLVNLGGGMVTDLGGFAAATFKRGIHFINIPTTLLAMVDAAVGGKTGINFGGMKNEIGTFQDASRVIINTDWLKTLDTDDLRSGYAEMLKHGLLDSQERWARLVGFDLSQPDWHELAKMIEASIDIKLRYVRRDPLEKDIRKSLNLGHTFGHAIEEWSLSRQALPHGHAVAFGLVCELYLSTLRTGFPTEQMQQTVRFVREFYGTPAISCQDYDELVTLMHHDKKSHHGEIRSVLLSGFGRPIIDQTVGDEEAREALDFLREGA